MRFCSFLRRVGIVIHAIGLLMFLLGFMTVNWVKMPYRRGSAGLWQICLTRPSYNSTDNSTSRDISNTTSVVVTMKGIFSSPPPNAKEESNSPPGFTSMKPSSSGPRDRRDAEDRTDDRFVKNDTYDMDFISTDGSVNDVSGVNGASGVIGASGVGKEEPGQAKTHKLEGTEGSDVGDVTIIYTPPDLNLDSDGCWKYGVAAVDGT
ncbi:hypothetical protein PoB_002888100 [Plakobranchus ocellatus]|uniref:Uncharacterized protein n=1 Tax=Plakobranchus ocellatus TaxID=259542 RepID=A0AAV4A2I2_9GAST|nr:hypothetical protein PoB_002888100 [Plakobranchus ocellatus]